jgi:hypothetical protein
MERTGFIIEVWLRIAPVHKIRWVHQAEMPCMFAGLFEKFPVFFGVAIGLTVRFIDIARAQSLVMDPPEMDTTPKLKAFPQGSKPFRLEAARLPPCVERIIIRCQGEQVGNVTPALFFELVNQVVSSLHGKYSILDTYILFKYIEHMPMKKLPQKGGTLARKRIIADIPEPIYRALKVHSAQTDVEMREIIAEALKRYLGIKEGGESSKK